MITDLKMKKMENANAQKKEFSSPSLQASLRYKTHAFLACPPSDINHEISVI